MRKHYFSPTGGFCFSDLHETIPDDAVLITEEQHAELIAGQERGGRIVMDGDQVTLDFSPPPTDPAFMGVQAARRLQESAATVLGYLERGEAVPEEWVAYRAALRKIAVGDSEAIMAGIPPTPDHPS